MRDICHALDATRCEGLGKQQPWAEPDWSILQREAQKAPVFPTECFGNARSYLERAAAAVNVKPDYPAAMLLAAVGALIGKQVSVRVNSDWIEPLITWQAIVGEPSSGKTPACRPIREYLNRVRIRMAEKHEQEISAEVGFAEADGMAAAQIENIREKAKFPPRCVVNDSTAEALARIEARSPRGLLLFRDELAGLIEGLDRYNKGNGDRTFYLEAFNGGPYTQDRVKDGEIAIPNHCFSIVGGIQPDRLRQLLTHTGSDDGFASRLLFFWPDQLPAGRIPAGTQHDDLESALNRIDAFPIDDEGIELGLSEEAYGVFDDWYLEDRGSRVGTKGKLGSAYGKLAGYVLRLAGILHILDWAFSEANGNCPFTISPKNVLAALTLIEKYFVPQLKRVYQDADRDPIDTIASGILNYCKKNKVREFSLRKARREWEIGGHRAAGAAKQFDTAADLLVDGEWIRKSFEAHSNAKSFTVNPRLFQGN